MEINLTPNPILKNHLTTTSMNKKNDIHPTLGLTPCLDQCWALETSCFLSSWE